MSKITTAVIPAAGLGSRSLPWTKELAKELLPVGEQPALQWIVEEAVNSGITKVVLIVSRGKEAIINHFDRHHELERVLEEKGKLKELDEVKRCANLAEIISVRQDSPKGLGDAILRGKSIVGDNPFAVILPDDLLISNKPGIKQLMDVVENGNSTVISLMEVEEGQEHRYGMVKAKQDKKGVYHISELVEKPKKWDHEPRLAITGRYVLPNNVFWAIEQTTKGSGGEIQLTDSISVLLKYGYPVRGVKVKGTRWDIGDPVQYMLANVDVVLSDPILSDRARRGLEKILKNKNLGWS
jgi:UTP--glucose-1-phosphate uridylyltransferase